MLGFALGTVLLRREALRRGLEPGRVVDAVWWVLPASLIGARLAHVLLEAPDVYARDPLLAFSPEGGWVFYGGLAGALLAGGSYARRRGVSFWTLGDVFAPSTAFGLVFGRLGCLGGGCCYGRPADWPTGVTVPWSIAYYTRGQLPDELLAVPLHPAPLYEALLCLGLFLCLSALAWRQQFPGQILLTFAIGYGVGRSLLELFRADAERGLYFDGLLSTSQIIGLATALLAAAVYRARANACTPSSSV
jgi:phosphatidylglycerol:prolipoprotein diacylglycerol transferase